MEKTYGSAWRRLAAFLLDSLIWVIPTFVIVAIFDWRYPILENDEASVKDFVLAIIYFFLGTLPAMLYVAWIESKRGYTFGKKIMHINVQKISGEKMTFKRAFARQCLKHVSFGLYYIGFLIGFFTEKKQMLHDLCVEAVVVNRKKDF